MPEAKVDLQVIGVSTQPEPIEYELVFDKLYEPEASEYVGEAEVATIYFDALPEQIPLMDTLTTTITEAVAEHVLANEGTMLQLRIFRAKGEWYNSKWKVEATIHASPFPWAIAIVAICAVLVVVGFAFISYQVSTLDWGQPATYLGLGLGLILILGLVVYGMSQREKTKSEKT